MVDVDIVPAERAISSFMRGPRNCILSLSENEIELKSSLGSNFQHNDADVLLLNVKEVTCLFILIDSAMWHGTRD